jgi:hypothetical protein
MLDASMLCHLCLEVGRHLHELGTEPAQQLLLLLPFGTRDAPLGDLESDCHAEHHDEYLERDGEPILSLEGGSKSCEDHKGWRLARGRAAN